MVNKAELVHRRNLRAVIREILMDDSSRSVFKTGSGVLYD